MNTAVQQAPQRRITVIPANPQLTERDIRKKHLRVAPYCRVSTDSEEQLNSYNAQIAYYTEKIAATFDQRMADITDGLEQTAGIITEVDEVTVRQLVSNIKVVSKDTLLICFKDGTEITQTV